MPVALRSSSISGTSDTSGTSCTVPVPTGAQSGDIALLAMEHWETYDATGITWPSGFTVVVNGVLTGNRLKLYVAWKRLTAADTGNYVVTWTSTQWNMGHCLMISGGLASGDPIEASNTATGTGTTLPSVSVTTATLAFLAHIIANENAASGEQPTNFIEERDGDYLKSNYRIPGSTGTFTTSGGSTSAPTAKIAALIAVKPAAGGGSSLAVNTATETDVAQSLGKAKLRPVNLTTETDTALTLGRSKVKGAATAAETDTALGFARSKARSVSTALSSETALPIGVTRLRPLGTASGTETALPIGRAKIRAVGLASESDAAQVIGSQSGISQPINTATSAEQALPIGHRRSRAIGTALEFDTAGEAGLLTPAWRLVMPTIEDRYTIRGSLATTLYREATVFGDESGLFITSRGSKSPGSDSYGAIPFGTKYIWYGGHVNVTDDPAVKNLWLAHGFEVENVQL